MAEDIIFKHLSAGVKLEQAEDDADGRHIASGAGTEDFALFDASDRIVNKTPLTAMGILLKGGNLLHVPTNAGWTEVVVGTGTVAQGVSYLRADTLADANSSALAHSKLWGFNAGEGGNSEFVSWDKKLYVIFRFTRPFGSNAALITRMQLKEVNTIGALATKGLGIRVDNLALKGESYGTALGVVDLAFAFTQPLDNLIVIILYPGSKIEWYVDGVLKGTQSTANNIPSGVGGASARIVLSIKNMATAVRGYADLYQPKLWQEA